jgi:hypothetical protein
MTDPRRMLALAVRDSVWRCLLNAQEAKDEAEQERWFAQADKLERKFKTEHGMHYSEAI